MRKFIHMPTLIVLFSMYLVAIVTIFCIPHRADGFGRMNAYQGFAQFGKVLSFGLLDRTLVDWYMLGPTLEENIGPYNQIVGKRILQLTPIFIAWFVAVAAVLNWFKKIRIIR
jgi:hypothetical protein